MLRDNPRNGPVVECVRDTTQYKEILKNRLVFVEYLSGRPPEQFRRFYSEGMWKPHASRVCYGLLCIAIRRPELEPHFHRFCSIWQSEGDRCGLTSFTENPIVDEVRDLYLAEINGVTG
jgi:hypothetical protein